MRPDTRPDPRPPERHTPSINRRQVLAGTATLAAGLVVTAGCSSGSSGGAAEDTGGARPGSSAPDSSAPRGQPGGSGADLVALSAVPVGGGVSAQDAAGRPLVVAQPKEGTIVAFSAICTHMGCTVAPQGGEFKCPCHGSVYALATGDNVSGPAPRPLAKVAVKVVKDKVVEA
jgi:Rieske Fe-S protein